MKRRVAITTTTFGEYNTAPLDLLKKNNFDIVRNNYNHVLSMGEILVLCKGCVGIIAGTEYYDFDTLKRLKDLRVISRVGVGIDSIDIKAADKLGIRVVNTPFGSVRAVAELTIGLMFILLRKVSIMDRDIRFGIWRKQMGNLLYGKKVGIIGYGRVGQKVAELLMALGCKTAYYDPKIKDKDRKCKLMQLVDLLEWADIITIHVSGNTEVIGKDELKHMKKGSWLINVSRGGTVNEDALYFSLKNGHLSGAAIDVFSEEPYSGILKEIDNVVLTPHIGSYAIESRIKMEIDAVKNLIKTLSEVNK